MTLDVEHLSQWVGREEVATDILSEGLAQRYHATFDTPGEPPRRGEAAPRLIHWCLAPPVAATATLGADGHPARGGFLPPVDLPRRMWAGSAITFAGDICVGDEVRRVSRVAAVTPKTGRTGTLLFVAVEHAVFVGNAVRVRERQDIVYRDAGGASQTLPEASVGQRTASLTPTPTFLFRYSALTFNGHRIHYDRSYATDVEGYAGLVVHGPLQAALLLNFAAALRGAPPARYTFRGASPVFDGAPLALNADDDGAAMRLWTARPGGPEALIAEAAWD